MMKEMNMGSDLWLVGAVVAILLVIKFITSRRRKKQSETPATEIKTEMTPLPEEYPSVPLPDIPDDPDGEDVLTALSGSLHYGLLALRYIMIALALIFLFSNIYWVEEGQVAIHTRFGKVLERNGLCTVKPGGPYFALPYPIDRIIRIPTGINKVAVDKAFWVETADTSDNSLRNLPDSEDGRNMLPSLVPGYDGSLITADKNVVQGKWTANYQLAMGSDNTALPQAAADFAANVGSMPRAEQLVRQAVTQAILKEVARTPVDDFVKGRINYESLRACAQEWLDLLGTGLIIGNISGERNTVALYLQHDFRAVTQAESEKAEKIEAAKRYRAEILNEAAGADFQSIIDAIGDYDAAVASGSPVRKTAAEREIVRRLDSERTGGQVAELFGTARTYRTSAIEGTRGASQRFELMLAEYSVHPVIFRNRLIQDALQTVFSGKVKTFYLPAGAKTLYLELNR